MESANGQNRILYAVEEGYGIFKDEEGYWVFCDDAFEICAVKDTKNVVEFVGFLFMDFGNTIKLLQDDGFPENQLLALKHMEKLAFIISAVISRKAKAVDERTAVLNEQSMALDRQGIDYGHNVKEAVNIMKELTDIEIPRSMNTLFEHLTEKMEAIRSILTVYIDTSRTRRKKTKAQAFLSRMETLSAEGWEEQFELSDETE